MNDLSASLRELAEALSLLRAMGAKTDEGLKIVKLSGDHLNAAEFDHLLNVQSLCGDMDNRARIELDGESVYLSTDPWDKTDNLGRPWTLQIGKSSKSYTGLAPRYRCVHIFFFADLFKGLV